MIYTLLALLAGYAIVKNQALRGYAARQVLSRLREAQLQALRNTAATTIQVCLFNNFYILVPLPQLRHKKVINVTCLNP